MVKRYTQWCIVWFLVNLCGLLDLIPMPGRGEHGWSWGRGFWGCHVFKLAEASDKLDQRWHTGVWEPVHESPPKE